MAETTSSEYFQSNIIIRLTDTTHVTIGYCNFELLLLRLKAISRWFYDIVHVYEIMWDYYHNHNHLASGPLNKIYRELHRELKKH